MARQPGVRAGGREEALATRISANLSGVPLDDASPAARSTAHLVHGSTEDTLVPVGQRCSQPLRAWFAGQVGAGCRLDEPMRELFAATSGSQTLGDALRHWQETRVDGDG